MNEELSKDELIALIERQDEEILQQKTEIAVKLAKITSLKKQLSKTNVKNQSDNEMIAKNNSATESYNDYIDWLFKNVAYKVYNNYGLPIFALEEFKEKMFLSNVSGNLHFNEEELEELILWTKTKYLSSEEFSENLSWAIENDEIIEYFETIIDEIKLKCKYLYEKGESENEL